VVDCPKVVVVGGRSVDSVGDVGRVDVEVTDVVELSWQAWT
jgi:hypothetical protein